MTADAASTTTRLAWFYVAFFAVVGVFMPFWPVWLEHAGLEAAHIGLFLAMPALVRAVVSPWIAQTADRLGQRRLPMLWLAGAGTVLFALFGTGLGFWGLLLVSIAFGTCHPTLGALGESLTVLSATRHGLDYGRIRLWGSAAFIVTAALSGSLVESYGPPTVFWLILGLLLALAVACYRLPDVRPTERHTAARAPALQLLASPAFWCFAVAASLVQASHAVYYGFGTLLWQRAGHRDDLIGALWGVGVIAEIGLFASGPWLARRLQPTTLLLIGAGAAIARWLVTGATASLWALIPAQLLHALSFGATHLGAIRFIADRVRPSLSATAQTIYAGLSHGGFMGLSMLIAGGLVDRGGTDAYHAMVWMAACGAIAALALIATDKRSARPLRFE
ncbi:MAG: MFS transporter [Planctomycetota bacterium]